MPWKSEPPNDPIPPARKPDKNSPPVAEEIKPLAKACTPARANSFPKSNVPLIILPPEDRVLKVRLIID